VAKLLVTGMSGTGKSAVLRELATRGHRTVDTDTEEWSAWATDASGEPDWVWRVDRVTQLLESHTEGHLFVSGCKTNQGQLYPLFDRVVLLSAPTDVLLSRIAERTDNPYGKSSDERSRVLRDVSAVLPRLRAGASDEIDTSGPIASVADRLETLANDLI
jgi:dephospho-CoA kinase